MHRKLLDMVSKNKKKIEFASVLNKIYNKNKEREKTLCKFYFKKSFIKILNISKGWVNFLFGYGLKF